MLLPKFDLPTRQDTFEVRLLEFVRDEFPTLTLRARKSGPQSRYFLRREDELVVEIVTLPYADGKLEVRVSAPLYLQEDKDFVREFYGWARRTYPGARIPAVEISLLSHSMMVDPPDAWGDPGEWRCIAERGLPPLVELMQEPTPGDENTSKLGRPRLTEQELQKHAEVIKKIERTRDELDITLEQACAREGVPYSTFRDWRRRTKNDE